MPKYEDEDGNDSTHSLESEYGGLDVPTMRTPRCSTREKTDKGKAKML